MRFVAFALFLCSAMVLADANVGEMAGFRLGGSFPVGEETETRMVEDGELEITVPADKSPEGFNMRLYASPKSHVIGRMVIDRLVEDRLDAEILAERLRCDFKTKYGSWKPETFDGLGTMKLSQTDGKHQIRVWISPVSSINWLDLTHYDFFTDNDIFTNYQVMIIFRFHSEHWESQEWHQLVDKEMMELSRQ